MHNKIFNVKNAKLFIKDIENNLKLANICKKTIKHTYKGEY